MRLLRKNSAVLIQFDSDGLYLQQQEEDESHAELGVILDEDDIVALEAILARYLSLPEGGVIDPEDTLCTTVQP